jgi:3'-5' exoribonuclease
VWVQQKADAISAETSEPFPQKTIDLIQHIILSHHGAYEFGSPKLPMTAEAMALHYLDNLDAKMHMFAREIANDPDSSASFTSFQRQLDVRIYKNAARLDGDPPPRGEGLFSSDEPQRRGGLDS